MKKILLIIGGAFLVTACTHTILSNFNEDPDADFGRYTTFAWDTPLNKAADESFNPLVNNTLVNKQVKDAIQENMEGKGYKLSSKNPDLVINFHTMLKSKSEVTSYPNNYYFWWRNDIRTINYEEGTLVIDLIDTEKDQLVWQGYTSGAVTKNNMARSLQDAVSKIFSKYPYRAGMGKSETASKK